MINAFMLLQAALRESISKQILDQFATAEGFNQTVSMRFGFRLPAAELPLPPEEGHERSD